MLVGNVRYEGHDFTLRGYDMGQNFLFYISCPLNETRRWLDAGIEVQPDDDGYVIPASWEDLYFSIGEGNATVSLNTTQVEEVTYKSRVNAEVLQVVASVIRGAKSLCVTRYREDALEVFSGEFMPSKTRKYKIPDMYLDGFKYEAIVVMRMCNVVEMDVKCLGRDIQVTLEEDYSYMLKVNKTYSRSMRIPLVVPKNNEVDDSIFEIESGDLYTISEIIERNPNKNYLWINDRKYEVVSDIEKVGEICNEIWNHDGVVSFDTETTGLNFTFKCFQGQGDKLVGMVFSIREGESWYFPIRHKKVKNICFEEDISSTVIKYFKKILEKKSILCHNGSFDWKVMYTMGIFLNLKEDSYILYKVTLWNDNRGLLLNLKDLTKVLLGRDSFELHDFVPGKWGEGAIKFWDLDLESTKHYACPDTDNALGLRNYANENKLLEKYGAEKIYEIEVAFSIVIAYQEFYGHCADVERVENLVKEIEKNITVEYEEMVKIVGHDFNPRSTKDLTKVMFEELGYPVLERTEKGNPSAGKKVLKRMIDAKDSEGNLLYPLVQHLKVYKDNALLKSNFTNNLSKLATEDGFMFSEVKQFLETGRVSIKDPNYQSYNDTVKKYIIPRDGYYMVDSDYSSIEYRILASMAGQMNLVERFKDPDMDYHTYQASRMFKVPYELVTKSLRSQAKGINFGLPYGMADPKLGESLYGARTPENTARAAKMRSLYFEGQEHIEQFFTKARADGVRNSYSETYFGRRRYFDKRKTDEGSIERQAGNNRIQGTAADIYKIAMVRLLNRIRNNGWLGKVLISCFVHDECVLEVHKSIDPCVLLKNLRSCLMLDMDGWCPLYIGAGFGTNWYDAKKTEIPVQVQEKMVNTWGTTGLDWWNGDTEKLFDWEVGEINDYKRDRVISYLENEDNWNMVLQPVENGFAHEVLDEILAGRHVDGVVDKEVYTSSDTVENLEQFCKAFGILDLFAKANIQRPVYTEEADSVLEGKDEQEVVEESFEEIIRMKVNSMGVGVDTINKKVYIRFDDDAILMKVVRNIIDTNPGDYEVFAYQGDELYSTDLSMSPKGHMSLMRAYMSRRNAVSRKC